MADDTTAGIAQQASARELRIKRVGGDSAPTYYANNVWLSTSLWDVKLSFGVMAEQDEEGVAFQDVANVIMSPQHARVFLEVLATQIAEYERKFGPIPRPPQATEEVIGGAE